MSLPHLTRREIIFLLLLLLLAAIIRLEQIGISDFRYDEGILSSLATNWLQHGIFPTRGLLASVGLPQGPLMAYLIAVPYAIFKDPLSVTAFIAWLNVGGVLFLWLLARRMFSPTVAWVAGVVYAVSPWANLYSRKIWNPNMHTPLLLLGLLLAWVGVWERRHPWAQLLAVALVLVVPQFHYQGWLLLPVLLVIFWQGRRNISWLAVVAGVALALLLWMPLITSITPKDVETFNSFSSTSATRTWAPRDQPWGYVVHMVTGWYIDEEMVGPENALESNVRVPMAPVAALWSVFLILAVLGALTAWRRYRGHAESKGIPVSRWRTASLYVWAFFTPIVVTPDWTRIFGHYFTLILPALFIFVGLGAEQLIIWGRNRRSVIALVSAGIGVALISQFVWWHSFLNDLDQNYMPYGFGTPLHYLMEGRQALADYDDVLIIGGNPFLTTDSSIWKPLLYGQSTCVRDLVIAGGNVAVLPDHPFAVLVASYAAPYSLRDFYTVGEGQTIPLRPGEDPYTIYTWDAAPEWTEADITPITANRFENGVRLTGYALTPDSVYLQWHIDQAGSRDNVQYFAHFFNEASERIGQSDSTFYDVQYWCAGDTIITRVDTPVPAETVRLAVGQYRLIDGKARGLSTIDEAGNPTSGTIEIELPAMN